jgi:hypothetical protein
MPDPNSKGPEPDYLQNVTPIGLERLRENIPTAFSSYYLTSLAMIQGVALGWLFYNSIEFLKNGMPPKEFTWTILPFSVLTLGIIAIVWHEYVLSTIEFWWRIGWIDTFIPLLMGFTQFALASVLDKPPLWCYCGAVMSVWGLGAYINFGYHVKKEYFEEAYREEGYRRFLKHIRIGGIYQVGMAVVFWVAGRNYESHPLLWTIVVSVVLVVFMIRRWFWWESSMSFYRWRLSWLWSRCEQFGEFIKSKLR